MNAGGGVLYVGDAGMLMHETYGNNPTLIGDGVEARAARHPANAPAHRRRPRRPRDELDPRHTRRTTASSPFEVAVPLNETMMLGDGRPSRRTSRSSMTARAGRITNSDDANRFLDRTYREGWSLLG